MYTYIHTYIRAHEFTHSQTPEIDMKKLTCMHRHILIRAKAHTHIHAQKYTHICAHRFEM